MLSLTGWTESTPTQPISLNIIFIYISDVGFAVVTGVVMVSTIFWDITPYGPLKVNRRFWGIYCLHLQDRNISRARNQRNSSWPRVLALVSCSAYSSTLKMEETSVHFQHTTRCYSPEDSTIYFSDVYKVVSSIILKRKLFLNFSFHSSVLHVPDTVLASI
jgi:hypothetical protein